MPPFEQNEMQQHTHRNIPVLIKPINQGPHNTDIHPRIPQLFNTVWVINSSNNIPPNPMDCRIHGQIPIRIHRTNLMQAMRREASIMIYFVVLQISAIHYKPFRGLNIMTYIGAVWHHAVSFRITSWRSWWRDRTWEEPLSFGLKLALPGKSCLSVLGDLVAHPVSPASTRESREVNVKMEKRG